VDQNGGVRGNVNAKKANANVISAVAREREGGNERTKAARNGSETYNIPSTRGSQSDSSGI
jgi:hypothetical protein